MRNIQPTQHPSDYNEIVIAIAMENNNTIENIGQSKSIKLCDKKTPFKSTPSFRTLLFFFKRNVREIVHKIEKNRKILIMFY